MKNKIPIYAIDFEGSKSLGIVEFGIVGIFDSEISFAKTALCAPKKKIDFSTAKITGISDELTQNTAPFESYLEEFSTLRQNGIFAAHNFHTEDSLLRHYIASAGRVKNFFTNKDTLTWAPWLDSRIIARELFKIKTEKLNEVISALNLQEELKFYAEQICPENRKKWHCALFDALASALIIKCALQNLPNLNTLAQFSKIETSNDTLF